MLVSVCIAYTHLSREKYRLEFCISGWNHMLQPYIESVTTLSDMRIIYIILLNIGFHVEGQLHFT